MELLPKEIKAIIVSYITGKYQRKILNLLEYSNLPITHLSYFNKSNICKINLNLLKTIDVEISNLLPRNINFINVCTNIESLTMIGCFIPNNTILMLNTLKNLTYLDMSCCHVSKNNNNNFTQLPNTITHLNISGCYHGLIKESLKHIYQLPLKKLIMNSLVICEEPDYYSIKHMTQLEVLCVSGCLINDHNIMNYLKYLKLKELDISHNDITCNILMYLAKMTTLESLNISNTDINDLSYLKNLQLVKLFMSKCDIRYNELQNINTNKLIQLDISYCMIRYLDEIKRAPNLRILDLSGNYKLTQYGLNAIKNIPIEQLYLNDCNRLTFKEINDIFKSHKFIKEIYIKGINTIGHKNKKSIMYLGLAETPKYIF